MSQASKIVLIIIITAIIAGGGVYLWQVQKVVDQPERQNNVSAPSEETKLKIFQNGGFRFQYPAEWQAESSSSPEIDSSMVAVSTQDWKHLEQGANFLVWINPPGSGYEYLVNDLGNSSVYVDDVLATKNLSTDESGKVNAAILKFNKDDKFYFMKYEFVAKNAEERNRYFAVLDNILNSFQFKD